jgi:23S rRNA pseudouridine1911/1915/1917 synthase
MEQSFDNEEDEDVLFEHYRIQVDKGQASMRLDKFLTDKIANSTRNKVQDAIYAGFVKVNNQTTKSNYKIRPLDIITVAFPEPPRDSEIKPENIPLNIVFEDEHILVINKSAGMVVHPGYNNWTGTLVNALIYHFQHLPTMRNNEGRPGLVHRIDKETSGLLVIAKTEVAMNHLAKQFYLHTIERTYYALVWGEIKDDKGTINVPLGRSLKDRRVTIGYTPESGLEGGKEAITHYEVLKRLRYVTLVKCNLETGRTHQIRAHMKHIGHPLFNDILYGGSEILKGNMFSKYKAFVENCFTLMPRQALHAKSLGFTHPITKEFMQFDSEIPYDFQSVLDRWENYVNYN